MKPTKYSDINILLDQLLIDIRSVLGNKLVGFYLYGSLVTEDFDSKVSDIDLLAALESDINDQDFDKLKEMHDHFARKYPEWSGRIEVHYMSTLALETFKTTTSKIASINPGDPLNIKEISKHWLMNWYSVQEKGLTLFGPSPRTFIDSISKEEFIESVKDHTRSWNKWVKDMKRKGAQAYAILTMCRALYAYRNGEQVSKKQAALWTRNELPEWSGLIQNALAWRNADKEEQDIEDATIYVQTEAFVNHVRSLILNKSQ